MRNRHVPTIALLLLTWSAGVLADENPPPLSAEQQEMLTRLDPQLAIECLEAARDVENGLREIEAIRRELQTGGEETVNLLEAGAKVDRLERLLQIAQSLFKRSPEFRKMIGLSDGVEKHLRDLDARAKSIRIDAQQLVDISEEDLRRILVGAARSKAAQALLEDLPKALQAVQLARNPAQIAQQAFEDLVTRRAFDQPVKFGDAMLRIKISDLRNLRQSLFAPDPGLPIELSYLDGKFLVEAKGFYFRVVNGKPVPVLDRLRVDNQESLRGQANRFGQEFANVIATGLDLPLTISRLEWRDFKHPDPTSRGSLILDGRFKLPGLLEGLSFEVKDVLITARGEVKLSEAGLSGKRPSRPPVPIGTTGMAFWGYTITLLPTKKQVSIGSVISSAEGDPRTFGFDVVVTVTLGNKPTLKMEGSLLVAGGRVGSVDATITEDKIEGNLKLPPPDGLPIGDLFDGEVHFKIDKNELRGEGDVALIRSLKSSVELVLEFNGRGSVAATDRFWLAPGVKAAGTLDTRFFLDGKSPSGFRKFDLSLTYAVDVDLKLYKPTAVVQVEASLQPKQHILVTASAMGATAKFEVNQLRDLTPERLAAELIKELPEINEVILDALADMEAEGARLLSRSEEQLRNYLSSRFESVGTIKTGDERFDAALGQISADGKTLFDSAGKSRERFGKAIGAMKTDPLGTVAGGINDLTSNLSGSLFGGNSGGDRVRQEERRRERQRQQELAREQKVDERLRDLLAGINRIVIDEQPPAPVPGRPRPKTVDSLNLVCFNPASAAVGEKDAVVGLLLRASGFAVKSGRRTTGSDTQSTTIRISNLLASDARPRVKIQIPGINHGSGLPAERMLRDELACIIERAIPGAEIEGYHRERKLAFRNTTAESVRIWVQTLTRGPEGKSPWSWLPGGPGLPGSAQEFLVPPGETRTLSTEGQFITGMAARFWAESESGQIWRHYLDENLWLVSEVDHLGRHRYSGDAVGTFTYELRPVDGPRPFKERAIVLANDTDQSLTIDVGAYTHTVGKPAAWRWVDALKLKPKETLAVKHSDGWILKGSKVRLKAQDDAGQFYRWTSSDSTPLTLTDKEGYRAIKIGRCTVKLTRPGPTEKAEDPATERAGRITSARLPADQVRLPDLTNQALRTARARVERLGLQARVDRDTDESHHVLEQSPKPSWRSPGSTVQLVVGLPVPQVTRKTLNQALREIQNAGLQAEYPADSDRDSTIVGQRPSTGYVQPNSFVLLSLKPPEPMLVEVPDVEGKSPEEASQLLSAAGLRPRWDPPARQIEHVHRQKPPPRTKVDLRANDVVVLAPGVDVPHVRGLGPEEALAILRNRGLSADISAERPEETVDPGMAGRRIVEDQSAVGKQPVGVEVRLNVTEYVLALVEVPVLRGLDLDQTRSAIEAAGLGLDVENEPDAGRVEDQRPAAGERVVRGTRVIAIFPPGLRLPDFTGETLDRVKTYLEERGIGGRVLNDSTQRIIDQQPDPGTLVRPGDVVVLYFPPKPANPDPQPDPQPNPPQPRTGNLLGSWISGNTSATFITRGGGAPIQFSIRKRSKDGIWRDYANGVVAQLTNELMKLRSKQFKGVKDVRYRWIDSDHFEDLDARLVYRRYDGGK